MRFFVTLKLTHAWVATLIGLANPVAALGADSSPNFGPAGAPLRTEAVVQFFQTHCIDSHGDGADEGDFELDSLVSVVRDPDELRSWTRLLQRVENLEMPPADAQTLDDDERGGFVEQLKAGLTAAVRHQQEIKGRGVVRRLNRGEFETALGDLVHLPLDIQNDLPADAQSHGFNTVGAALNVSSVQTMAWQSFQPKSSRTSTP